MSRLKKVALQKRALDKEYMNQPKDIQLDMIILPYLEQVGPTASSAVNFQFSGAVTDEIYKIITSNSSLSQNSTVREIKDACDKAVQQWQQEISSSDQKVANTKVDKTTTWAYPGAHVYVKQDGHLIAEPCVITDVQTSSQGYGSWVYEVKMDNTGEIVKGLNLMNLEP